MTLTDRSPGSSDLIVVLSALLVALALRLIVLTASLDTPGDGPIRALVAYAWSRSSPFETHGSNWLPGFKYLAGMFFLLVTDPSLSTRILNVIIGTLTLPVFYLLVRRLYGRDPALFSTALLAVLPLHVGLSASSLTEPSFLFSTVAATTLLIAALQTPAVHRVYLSLSVLCLYWAVTTRYEAWLLIPLFPAYYYWKTRRLFGALSILCLLLTFPAGWAGMHYLRSGEPAPFLHAQLQHATTAVGAVPVELVGALRILAYRSVSHLGWILVLGAIAGAIWWSARAIKGHIDAEGALHGSIVLVFWIFMLGFAMFRGRSVVDRNLLFGLVLTLPFMPLMLARYLRRRRRYLVLLICVAMISMGYAYLSRRPIVYVTTKQPTSIKTVAAWLETSPYRDDAILLTKMGWQSTYLPLYARKDASEFLIVSPWTKNVRLREFLAAKQPSLLITRDGDEEFQSRIEVWLGRGLRADSLVHESGGIKVFALAHP